MLSDKKFEKIEKILTSALLQEMEGLSDEDLKGNVLTAAQSIKAVQEELEANPKYQECKENLKALSQGLKDVKKFQNAKVAYALHLLEERGKV